MAAPWLFLLLGSLAGSLFRPAQILGQTDVQLRLERAGVVRVNLAMADFGVLGEGLVVLETAQSLREIVKNDLLFSDLFQVKDLASAGPQGDTELQAALDRLRGEAQDALLWGTVRWGTLKGTGRELDLEVFLYEVATRRRIAQESMSVDRERVRDAAHLLSDKLVLWLAGEQGIARTRIAFVSTREGAKEIFVMDYDGHNVARATENGSINMSPAWASGVDRLSLVSYIFGNPDIYLLDLRRPKLRALASSPGLDSSPAFSLQGDRIAFTRSVDGNPAIHVAEIDGGKLKDVKRITWDYGVSCCPSWSPGGMEIAFVSDRSGTPQVYVMEPDGSNVRRITFLGEYNASPAWSPRGDRIAFASRQEEGFAVFSVSPNGFDLQRLTGGGGSYEGPSWSPDGRHLALSSTRDGPSSIYVMNADGSNLRRLTAGRGEDTSPSWSPRSGQAAGNAP